MAECVYCNRSGDHRLPSGDTAECARVIARQEARDRYAASTISCRAIRRRGRQRALSALRLRREGSTGREIGVLMGISSARALQLATRGAELEARVIAVYGEGEVADLAAACAL